MGNTGKALKGCLLAAGALSLALAAVVGIYIAWSLHANRRAEAAATALCAGIRKGEAMESVLAKAAAAEPKPRVGSGSDGYHFTFQGAIFNARDCQVSTVAGRVTAAHVVVYDD